MPAWLFASLRGYRFQWLPRDLVAGLMLAAIAIPGQLATARLAGMPPQTGLYAFAAGALAFAALGANRYMSVAADSTIAPIFAGGLSSIAALGTAHYAELATLLAVLVGITLAAVGLLRAGWLATLLSIPVTTGFLAGISIHIIVSQLPDLLGVPRTDGHMLVQLVHILGRLGATNIYTLALGAGVLIVTLVTAAISHHIPGALIGLVGAGVAVAMLHLQSRGVDVLGALSVPPPRLVVPVNPGIGEWSQLVPLTLVVAMVCIMQTAAVASAFPSDPDEPDDTSRDFLGVGAGSILAGMVGAFAVDSSPPSTAIVRDSGGRSQIASLTAVALMIALALLASEAMAYVPRAALAGILVYIAIKIFRVGEMYNIWRRGGREILLVAGSAALVVVLPIESGMLLAIVLSFVHSLYIVARPYCAELARVPGTTVWWPPMPHDNSEREDGVMVFAPAAPLNFTNVQDIVGRIRQAIATRRPPVKLLVIEASGIIDIDYTGSQLLRRAIVELKKQGITVAIARLSHEQAQREAGRTGLVQSVGRDHVFMSVEEAVRKLGPRTEVGDFG
jgi:MFS superfamily sulfate permease-like transporter